MCHTYIFVHVLVFFLLHVLSLFFFFFFNDTATTEIYTLSLHDALPISLIDMAYLTGQRIGDLLTLRWSDVGKQRSEEHTSELQSPCNLVCRLLLEKKKKKHSSLPRTSSTLQRPVS